MRWRPSPADLACSSTSQLLASWRRISPVPRQGTPKKEAYRFSNSLTGGGMGSCAHAYCCLANTTAAAGGRTDGQGRRAGPLPASSFWIGARAIESKGLEQGEESSREGQSSSLFQTTRRGESPITLCLRVRGLSPGRRPMSSLTGGGVSARGRTATSDSASLTFCPL